MCHRCAHKRSATDGDVHTCIRQQTHSACPRMHSPNILTSTHDGMRKGDVVQVIRLHPDTILAPCRMTPSPCSNGLWVYTQAQIAAATGKPDPGLMRARSEPDPCQTWQPQSGCALTINFSLTDLLPWYCPENQHCFGDHVSLCPTNQNWVRPWRMSK